MMSHKSMKLLLLVFCMQSLVIWGMESDSDSSSDSASYASSEIEDESEKEEEKDFVTSSVHLMLEKREGGNKCIKLHLLLCSRIDSTLIKKRLLLKSQQLKKAYKELKVTRVVVNTNKPEKPYDLHSFEVDVKKGTMQKPGDSLTPSQWIFEKLRDRYDISLMIQLSKPKAMSTIKEKLKGLINLRNLIASEELEEGYYSEDND